MAIQIPGKTHDYLAQRLDGARDLYLLALALGERGGSPGMFGAMIREARIHFAAVLEEAGSPGSTPAPLPRCSENAARNWPTAFVRRCGRAWNNSSRSARARGPTRHTSASVESDEDMLLCETGHIPGAEKIDSVADLNDPLMRDYIDGRRGSFQYAEKH